MYDDQAYCRECGRMIRFLRTRKGKYVPVDTWSLNVVPRDEGGIFFCEDGNTVRGVAVETPGPKTVKAWQNHILTCPKREAAQSRKRAETWQEKQSRFAHERLEKEIAEAEEKAARREEKERKEAAKREFEDSQISFADLLET